MADNDWNLPASGAGVAPATDDIGGVRFQRIKLIHGVDGVNDGDVSSTNPLPINYTKSAAVIDISTTPLGIAGEYISAALDHSINGAYVTHFIFADVDGTHYAEESADGSTNWKIVDTESVIGGTALRESHQAIARYSRARFVNGGTAQATFIHQVIQKHIGQDEYVKIHSEQNQITGNKTSNAQGPSSNNLGVLPAIATASAPSHTEGMQVGDSVNLAGDTRVTLDGEAVVLGAGAAAIGKLGANSGVDIGDVDVTSIAAGDNNIGNVDIVTMPNVAQATASNLNAQVVGEIAHDGVDSGNPIKIGGIARTANPTAVAALDRVNAFFDTSGRQVVRLNAPRGLRIRNTITLTSTTETTLLAAAASTFHDLTKIIVINTSATAVRVDIRDTTGGSVIFAIYAPAGQTVGYVDSADPVEQASVNTNWTAQLSAAVTDIRIFAQAIKNVA